MSKPDACRQLLFENKSSFKQLYNNITFSIQFDILVPNYSRDGYFENEINSGLNHYKAQLKFLKKLQLLPVSITLD